MSDVRDDAPERLGHDPFAPADHSPAPPGTPAATLGGAVMRVDRTGRIIEVSPLARGWLGVRATDLEDRTIASLTVGEHRAAVIQWFAHRTSSEGLWFDLRRRAGRPGVVRAHLGATSPDDETVFVDLEGVVAPPGSTDARSTAQLATEIDELLRRNRELEALMAGVAHDLRAPLMTVASAAQGLATSLGAEPDEDVQALIARLLDSVGRMGATVDGALRNARAGERLDLAEVDLDALVALTVASLSRQIELVGATVECGHLGEVWADADQLGSVFLNLVENALRHRVPGRTPVVRISASDRGAERIFAVADNGPGIAPGDRERVLRLFERASDESGGTGVGLAVCQRIVDAHGGRIWLSGNLDGGTTARFTLPLRLGPSQARTT